MFFAAPSEQQRSRLPSTSSSSQTSSRRNQQPSPSSSTFSRGQPQPPRELIDDEDEDEESAAERFICPKADGLYADPANCKRFYLCGAWHAWSQACPPALYFDDKLKFCTFKTASLQCGPLSEEEIKEEEARGNQDGLPTCDEAKCQLPSCFCSQEGGQVPGNEFTLVSKCP